MSVFDQDDPGFQVTLDKNMVLSILGAFTLVCVLIFILGIVVGRNTYNPQHQVTSSSKFTKNNSSQTSSKISRGNISSTKPKSPKSPGHGKKQGVQPKPTTRNDHTFAVQAAFVSRRKTAEKIRKKLVRLGYSNAYISILEGKTTGYRIRVGPYKSRGEATNVMRRLRRKGYPEAWIVVN